MCQKIIKKRIANYIDYIEKHNTYMNKVQSDYRRQVKKIASFERVKSKDKKLTLAIKKNSSKANRTKELIQKEFKEQQMLSIRSYEELAGIANTLRFYRAKTQYICKVRDTGRIDCISLDSLLATYDNEMVGLILSDIDRTHEVYGLDFDNGLMFECGPGRWANMALSEASLSNFSDFLSDTGSENMLNKCSKYSDLLTNDSAESLANSSGFSGITGMDSFGLMSICGMDIGQSDFDNFIENAMKMSEELHNYCTSDPVAEDSVDGLGLTEIPTTNKVETVEPEEGATVESVDISDPDVDSDGNTTITTTTTFSDGTTRTQSTTTDPNGNVINTVTQTTKGGNTSTQVTTNDPQTGNTSTTNMFTNSDNGVTHIQTTVNGVKTSEYIYVKGKGSGHYDKDKGQFIWYNQQNCAGEPCQVCIDFASFNPKLIVDCATGGMSFTCDTFSNEADCCANEDAYPADPRLVIPNPMGDFMCTGGADLDLVDGMCQAQCSVAYSEDCYSNCTDLASRGLGSGVTLWDAICIYARAEACFIKEGSFPLDLPPIPTPELVEESTARLDPGRALDYGRTFLPNSIIEHIIVLPDER